MRKNDEQLRFLDMMRFKERLKGVGTSCTTHTAISFVTSTHVSAVVHQGTGLVLQAVAWRAEHQETLEAL